MANKKIPLFSTKEQFALLRKWTKQAKHRDQVLWLFDALYELSLLTDSERQRHHLNKVTWPAQLDAFQQTYVIQWEMPTHWGRNQGIWFAKLYAGAYGPQILHLALLQMEKLNAGYVRYKNSLVQPLPPTLQEQERVFLTKKVINLTRGVHDHGKVAEDGIGPDGVYVQDHGGAGGLADLEEDRSVIPGIQSETEPAARTDLDPKGGREGHGGSAVAELL